MAVLLITGKFDHVVEREAGNAERRWTEQTLVVLDFGVTYYVKVTRDFTDLPALGEVVALNVGVRAYPKKSGDGAGVEYLGFGVNREATAALGAALVRS